MTSRGPSLAGQGPTKRSSPAFVHAQKPPQNASWLHGADTSLGHPLESPRPGLGTVPSFHLYVCGSSSLSSVPSGHCHLGFPPCYSPKTALTEDLSCLHVAKASGHFLSHGFSVTSSPVDQEPFSKTVSHTCFPDTPHSLLLPAPLHPHDQTSPHTFPLGAPTCPHYMLMVPQPESQPRGPPLKLLSSLFT